MLSEYRAIIKNGCPVKSGGVFKIERPNICQQRDPQAKPAPGQEAWLHVWPSSSITVNITQGKEGSVGVEEGATLLPGPPDIHYCPWLADCYRGNLTTTCEGRSLRQDRLIKLSLDSVRRKNYWVPLSIRTNQSPTRQPTSPHQLLTLYTH